mmetsp:Transcript_56758/g.166110  ORF Transcript_56758/g.166110 Transcript_56758/m.166110 type:complete len:286 (+) Transcript_56758:64-921(+)
MDGIPRNISRSLLREYRLLGPGWTPRAPASDLLWGRGFRADPWAPHPLLLQSAPRCLHEGLAESSRCPFGTWLRGKLRHGLNSGCSPGSAVSEALFSDVNSAAILRFVKQQGALAACTSTSEEGGISVEAVSGYVQAASDTEKSQYVFAYNMRFRNTGSRRLRVLSRQYDFREGSGMVASQIKPGQPEAAGVVGFTPLVEPGSSFEFGSGVVLQSPRGMVTGRFLVMEEPEDMKQEDAQMHESMLEAELSLRYVYLKGLGTKQFHLPLGQLRFDVDVPCIGNRRN